MPIKNFELNLIEREREGERKEQERDRERKRERERPREKKRKREREREKERETEREKEKERERVCSHCPQNEVESELNFLTSCQMYDHIRDSHINWVKYHSVTSQQQDLCPVATRKGQPVKNKHHCKYNSYLC
jgi:hypothetical protein